MDTTPIWLIAIFIVIALVIFFGLELVKQYKDPENTHYDFNMLFGKDKQ